MEREGKRRGEKKRQGNGDRPYLHKAAAAAADAPKDRKLTATKTKSSTDILLSFEPVDSSDLHTTAATSLQSPIRSAKRSLRIPEDTQPSRDCRSTAAGFGPFKISAETQFFSPTKAPHIAHPHALRPLSFAPRDPRNRAARAHSCAQTRRDEPSRAATRTSSRPSLRAPPCSFAFPPRPPHSPRA